MFEELRNHFQPLVWLNEEEWALMQKKLVLRFLKKGDLYIRPGEASTHIAFVNKGLLRHFNIEEGIEVTNHFFVENTIASDFVGFLTQVPCSIYVDALEDSELFLLSYQDLQELYNSHAAFQKLGRLVNQYLFLDLARAYHLLCRATPDEQYLAFLERFPGLSQRVPQYLIASYLGITSETLSRIRRRTMRKSA
jgi:CRP/FNR family transcriptional regulator, anaerobic regulatory protein